MRVSIGRGRRGWREGRGGHTGGYRAWGRRGRQRQWQWDGRGRGWPWGSVAGRADATWVRKRRVAARGTGYTSRTLGARTPSRSCMMTHTCFYDADCGSQSFRFNTFHLAFQPASLLRCLSVRDATGYVPPVPELSHGTRRRAKVASGVARFTGLVVRNGRVALALLQLLQLR